jgi:streptogramin lyase
MTGKRFIFTIFTLSFVATNLTLLSKHASADPPITYSNYSIPTSGSYPMDITPGSDGNMWFVEYTGNKIGKITPSGTITEYSGGQNPFSIAADASGNLWFTPGTFGYLSKITTSGTTTDYSLATTYSPYAVATSPNGDVWFTEFHGGKIGRYTPSSATFNEYTVANGNGSRLTVDPQSNVWIADYNNNQIIKVSSSGSTTATYTLPSASNPEFIVVDNFGNAWFNESGHGKIGRINQDGTLSEFSTWPSDSYTHQARNLTIGPDGNVWFTGASGLSKITRDGTITNYAAGTYSGTDGITMAADGSIWSVNTASNTINKVTLDL